MAAITEGEAPKGRTRSHAGVAVGGLRSPAFETPIVLTGPFRAPRQMLRGQDYAGHSSIHDDATAASLGFAAGTIEGPTHFSQIVPPAVTLWGDAWFERGCISAHYSVPCYEGEQVRARLEVPYEGADHASVVVEKEDGTISLAGTVSVGDGFAETEVAVRLRAARPPERPVILDRLHIGQKGREIERVRMGFDEPVGEMYPFSPADKLEVITEPVAWYTPDGSARSPWGRPIIPFEMVSVLSQYSSADAFPVRQPSVALFLDQEIRMVHGPLFVDTDYVLDREIVGLGESRRTESYWFRTTIRDAVENHVVAVTTLHMGVLKESYQPDTDR